MAETTDTDEAASSVSAGNSSREDITHLYSYIEALPESSSSDVNLSTGVNFNREVEVFPSPRSSASFDSRRDRAPEHSIVPYRYSRSPRRVSAGSLHLRGVFVFPALALQKCRLMRDFQDRPMHRVSLHQPLKL